MTGPGAPAIGSIEELSGKEVYIQESSAFNKMLFALASYNGGQTRIRRLRRETSQQGLDADVWFHNVELAAAREIGRETVQFVRNVYSYYLVFRLIEEKGAQPPKGGR